MNSYILPVYKSVFGEDFDHNTFNCRLKMQKMVYLLQELGTSLGNYGFRWYKHGPYSQSLLDDMYFATPNEPIIFSEDSESNIKKLTEMMKDMHGYEQHEWAECLASLLYLKKYILSSSADSDEIIQTLVNRKPHLNNSEANKAAYDLIVSYL